MLPLYQKKALFVVIQESVGITAVLALLFAYIFQMAIFITVYGSLKCSHLSFALTSIILMGTIS